MRRWIRRGLLGLLYSMAVLGGTTVWGEEEEDASAEVVGSQYMDLKPAFVTNYGGPGGLRYLKADISLRVEGPSVGAVRHHMPLIRHAVVMTLSRQTEEGVSTTEGREILRGLLLQEVQNLLQQEEGSQHVTDLLFNAFIVQR